MHLNQQRRHIQIFRVRACRFLQIFMMCMLTVPSFQMIFRHAINILTTECNTFENWCFCIWEDWISSRIFVNLLQRIACKHWSQDSCFYVTKLIFDCINLFGCFLLSFFLKWQISWTGWSLSHRTYNQLHDIRIYPLAEWKCQWPIFYSVTFQLHVICTQTQHLFELSKMMRDFDTKNIARVFANEFNRNLVISNQNIPFSEPTSLQ